MINRNSVRVISVILMSGCVTDDLRDCLELDTIPASTIRVERDQAINLGERRLYLSCKGQGDYTLILEGGAGLSSLPYQALQGTLATDHYVCVYDRAGLGLSDVSSEPRTSQNIARDLHQLIEQADLPAPYILAGHSLGGYIIRQYQAEYPDQVAGLMFIDSAHPDQWDRLGPEVSGLVDFGAEQYRAQAKAAKAGALPRAAIEALIPDSLSDEQRQAYIEAGLSAHTYETAANEFTLAKISAQQAADTALPNDVPITVISAERSFDIYQGFGLPVDKLNSEWGALQDELETLSDARLRIKVDAAHNLVDTHLEDVAIAMRTGLAFIAAHHNTHTDLTETE